MTTKITRSNIASTGVAAGSYSAADITVNSSGQVTSASTSSIAASGGGGPKISGVVVTDSSWTVLDDTAVDVLGGYIKITGTGFNTGCLVYFNQTPASSVSFISSTELRVTTGALSAGTYVVYAINTDGGVAIRVPGVTFSASPAWQTSSSLSDQYDGVAISLSLVASDATSYTLVSGSLPPGLSLNTSTGAITGTVTGVTADTTYSFTVRATDAQNQDSPRTFTVTITVSDPYFNRTTLLLSGSALTTNTVLRDSSTNNFNLTAYGDARASNFTPYGTGWSVYFDGTGDYITIANNVALQLSNTIPWTIEFWFYANAMSAEQIILNSYLITGTPNYYGVGITLGSNNQAVTTMTYYDGTNWSNIATGLTPGRWYHVAVSYEGSGTTRRFFLDGILQGSPGTCPASITNTANPTSFGALSNGNGPFNGYISNARIVKGTALYTANFTPATTNLTAVANTSLLTCNANRFLDGSTNNFAITRNGDAKVVSFNPFNITNTGVNGSAYFDGTGDYLSTSNPAFAVGTGAFTIEAWVYPFNVSSKIVGSLASSADPAGDRGIGFYTDGARIGRSVTAQFDDISTSIMPVAYQWNHIALVRENTSTNGVKFYVNGLLGGQGTSAISVNKQQVVVGRQYPSEDASYFSGYISSVRWTNAAVYTGAFTPPAQPLTAISNTQLLTLQYDQPHNNHTFLDASSNQFLITRSGNATQGTFSPFSQVGWSNYFNGSSNYRLTIPDSTDLDIAGDFCLELWAYFTSTSASNQLVCIGSENAAQNGFILYNPSSTPSEIALYTNGATAITTSSAGITTNRWYHLALVRSGTGAGNMVIYVDGVSKGSAQITTSFTGQAANGLSIGQTYHTAYVGVLNAYLSNLRLVNGSPVYTGAFTPPTTPLTAITNTKLLTCQSNRFVDVNTQVAAKTITVTGSPSIQAFSPFAPTAVYSPVSHGGSAYFDGSDWLQITDSANQLEFGPSVGAGYLEIWYYPTQAGTQVVISKGGGSGDWSSTGFLYQLQFTSSAWSWHWKTAANNLTSISSGTYSNNQWFHVVVSSDGTTFALFVNGVRIGTNSTAAVLPTSRSQWRLGQDVSSNWAYGYCAGLKIVKNTVPTEYLVSATSYTVPTAPVVTTTNTQLLLNFTDAAILDSTGRTVIETVADARTSSVVTKFTGGSMYFDGTGDYLVVPSSVLHLFGTQAFTVEAWVYTTSTKQYQHIYGTHNDDTNWIVRLLDNKIMMYTGSAYITGVTVLATNTWYHVAAVREGTGTNQTKLYVNGTLDVTGTNATNYTTQSQAWIGAQINNPGLTYFQGYIADLRVTRGYARYTANFTPPTVPHRLK